MADDWHNDMKLSHVFGHLSGYSWKTTVWGGDPAMDIRKWQSILTVWLRSYGDEVQASIRETLYLLLYGMYFILRISLFICVPSEWVPFKKNACASLHLSYVASFEDVYRYYIVAVLMFLVSQIFPFEQKNWGLDSFPVCIYGVNSSMMHDVWITIFCSAVWLELFTKTSRSDDLWERCVIGKGEQQTGIKHKYQTAFVCALCCWVMLPHQLDLKYT